MGKYINQVEIIMKELFRATREGGYNAWVVKDFRDTKNGIPYVDLHSKVAAAGEKAGAGHGAIGKNLTANSRDRIMVLS